MSTIRTVKMVCVLLLPLIFLACASKAIKPEKFTDNFVTDIKDNDLKLFIYSVQLKPHGEEKGSPSARHRRATEKSGQGGRHASDKRESLVRLMGDASYTALDVKLAANGYCREGYIEIDHYIEAGQAQIRGECKEGATPDDRQNYPNEEGAIRAATTLRPR